MKINEIIEAYNMAAEKGEKNRAEYYLDLLLAKWNGNYGSLVEMTGELDAGL